MRMTIPQYSSCRSTVLNLTASPTGLENWSEKT